MKEIKPLTNPIFIHPQETFALYRLPRAKAHFLIQQEDRKHIPLTQSAFQTAGFAFHPFRESSEAPAIFIKKERHIANAVINFHATHDKSINSDSKQAYLEKVEAFIDATKRGFQKLVLSRTKVIDVQAGNLFHLFQSLKNAYPSAFVYLVNIANVGCWIGATPEKLFSQNDMAETMALAGTQQDLGLPLNNVFWRQKEREEQAIVERYFQQILMDKGIAFKKSPRHTVRAGNVLHLRTNFQFPIQNQIYPLIRALHPSPAVCGMPQKAARRFILKNEPHDRAYYAGFLGPANIDQHTDLFVNLRCMQVFSNRFVLYVGGGILPDSNPEKEWLETEMKAKTLSDVIEKVYLSEQFAM